MNLEWKDLIILVLILTNIVAMFGLYRSVPREFVMLILGFLEQKAKETPDTTDDKFVAEGRKFIERLMPEQAPAPATGGTPAAG